MASAGVLRATLAGGLLVVLSACTTPQMQSPPETPAPPAQDMASLSVPEPPAVEMTPEPPPPPPEPPPPVEVLPPPEPEPPPPPPPPPMPTDAQSLRAAYGTPAFIRREADSELWRYDGTSCAAFFFLYLDGGTYRVRHAETNPRGQDAPADPDCLRSLIVPSGDAPAGARMS